MKAEAIIVSVGSWNSRIFTPAWVAEYVFDMPKGETMNIALDEQQLSLTYIWNGIQFLMTNNRVILKTDSCSKEKLCFMEKCYQRLSDTLSYTPISAVGFNVNLYLTQEEFCETEVYGIIQHQSIANYVNSSQTFSAMIEKVIRNFTIRTSKNGVEIVANFHYQDFSTTYVYEGVFEIINSELKKFLGNDFAM